MVTAAYPTTIAAYGQTGFHEFNNLGNSTLSAAISGLPATYTVASAGAVTTWPTVNFVTRIENELIFNSSRSGTTVTVGSRGFGGTSAADHANASTVRVVADADTLMQAFEEIIAMQSKPGVAATMVTTKSANYTLTTSDFLIPVSAPGGAVTITLPTAVGIKGRMYAVTKADSTVNDVTLDGNGAETVGGSANQVLGEQGDSILVMSDNANWQIIGERKKTEARDARSESGNYTVTDADYFIAVNASGAARTISLPTAVGREGKIFVIKKTDTSVNAVTVDPNGAETIDGYSTVTLTIENDAIEVISDNSNWKITSDAKEPGIYASTNTKSSAITGDIVAQGYLSLAGYRPVGNRVSGPPGVAGGGIIVPGTRILYALFGEILGALSATDTIAWPMFGGGPFKFLVKGRYAATAATPRDGTFEPFALGLSEEVDGVADTVAEAFGSETETVRDDQGSIGVVIDDLLNIQSWNCTDGGDATYTDSTFNASITGGFSWELIIESQVTDNTMDDLLVTIKVQDDGGTIRTILSQVAPLSTSQKFSIFLLANNLNFYIERAVYKVEKV